MGKASRRRQMRRAEFLSDLAVNDPARFSEEWLKRVQSWSLEATHNIRVLRDADNKPTPLNSELVRYAEEQLIACGPQAYHLEANFTKECLLNECSLAFANSVDSRSYRLTNTRETCNRSELYRSKR
jgi:hypothetical protein